MLGCSSSPATLRKSLKRDWSFVERVGWLMLLAGVGAC